MEDAQRTEPAYWTATTATTSVPADKSQEELRGFFSFDIVKTFTGEIPLPDVTRTPIHEGATADTNESATANTGKDTAADTGEGATAHTGRGATATGHG
ncbi:hypothetical protein ACFQ1S_36300, partial [Kibdelosporangium lantanae]